MRIAITGANGFLGSHLVEMASYLGHEVTALLRAGANTENLESVSGFKIQEIDYSTEESIIESLKNLPKQDLIIHNAGLTKSYTLDKYLKVNVQLTEKLINAIQKTQTLSESGNFAYISSLAAMGPVGNGGPASNYGRSKVMAEKVIMKSGLNYAIFRPSGIYGERDVQFVPLIKAARLGLYPLMTSATHKMTMIHASDVARNVIENGLSHSNVIVPLDDGNIYLHKDLQRVLESAIQKKTTTLKVPKGIVKGLLYISDIIDRNLKRTPKLSLEHYKEISQDWDHDFSDIRKQVPLLITISLEDGFKRAVKYYKSKNLI